MDYKLIRSKGLHGKIKVSTDKSISHRALMVAALANGTSTITDLSKSEDVQRTRKIMEQLGVSIEQNGSKTIVQGVGINGFRKPECVLDAGNSGTTMRLMSGILAAQPFGSTLTGDASLRKRPMSRIINPLTMMGAQIDATETGTAPLKISGADLRPVHYHSPVSSAQVKSSILLAGMLTRGTTRITEPFLSRDHTEKMLPDFGVPLEIDELTVSITGKAQPVATDIIIPGDISSAAFFMVAAAITPDSEIEISNVGLNPTRTGIVDVLQKMGADVQINPINSDQNEPLGNIIIRTSQLRGIEISAPQIPKLIDELPIIAIAAVAARGKTIVTGAAELRVKESDRLHSIATNLRAMGIQIKENEDGFEIDGPQNFQAARLNSFDDHRIAMAFSIAALNTTGECIIVDADCAAVSMPDFYSTLKNLNPGK